MRQFGLLFLYSMILCSILLLLDCWHFMCMCDSVHFLLLLIIPIFSPKNRTVKSIVKKGYFLEEVLFLTTKIPLLKNRTFPYHKLNTANLYRSDISPGLIMPKASTLCSVRQKGTKSIFLKKITYCFKKYLFLKEVGTFC